MSNGRPASAGLLSIPVGDREVPVVVIRSPRRRRTISFSVKNGAVVVRSPQRTPIAFLRGALEGRQSWIARQLAAGAERPSLTPGALLPYLGCGIRLYVDVRPDRQRSSVKLVDGVLEVFAAGTAPDGELEALVSRLVGTWYRREAERILPGGAARLAMATGLSPSRVLVRSQRTRWGSCSADGTIRLSWRLVMLPPELAEYVILHELTHLRHRHHRPEFWAALETLSPGARATARRLHLAGRGLPEL